MIKSRVSKCASSVSPQKPEMKSDDKLRRAGGGGRERRVGGGDRERAGKGEGEEVGGGVKVGV